MGRQAIILVVGMAILLGVMRLRLNRIGLGATETSISQYDNLSSLNLANSGIQLALLQLKQEPTWRTGYVNLNLDQGTVDVDILDSSSDSTLGEDTLRLYVASLPLFATRSRSLSCLKKLGFFR